MLPGTREIFWSVYLQTEEGQKQIRNILDKEEISWQLKYPNVNSKIVKLENRIRQLEIKQKDQENATSRSTNK